jgi:chaperonin cofactor prefoldin
MCEFVVDHVDVKKMSQSQKKKLTTQLEQRRKDLQKKVNALEKTIRKVKGR